MDGRADIAGRRGGPGAAGAGAAGDLREVAQVAALGGVDAEGVGERVNHGRGGVAVAALLQPGQVLDAVAGADGQVGAAQSGRAAAAVVGQAERLGLDAVALGVDEAPSGVPMRRA
ncbi:hypothetical protein AQI95_39135 [Streptomyces yokosukanensis]|uniref:Uncharacterized protein n=1 Tax=Streptomyces yokosukanensis TaxID=67386 RepID=A0A101NU53_9ACTN|nr:hypothetical protein AQI95_39135 [Streptomyces yokosukanensis]